MFPFDHAAATELVRASDEIAAAVSSQGVLRSAAAEHALQEFRGAYVGARKAEEERQRREAYAAWETRAAEREQRRRLDPAAALAAGVDEVVDRPPSDRPVVPPPIRAAFAPQSVARTSPVGSAGGGTTSADPEHLDVFVSQTRQADEALRSRLHDLMAAWGAFGNRCSWAPVESFSVLQGFRELLSICAADATWVEQISLAFAAAGGGALSTPVLDTVSTLARPLGGRRLLDSLAALSSAREGRDRVVEFVRNSAERLEIEGWWPRNGAAGPDVCGLGDGLTGASYSYDWWAPAGTEVEGDARKVADSWESLGMTGRVTDSTPRPPVYGAGGPVLRATFVTGAVEEMDMIGAEMPCVPGDVEALLFEDEAQRADGVVLPGDEGIVLQPRENQMMPTPDEGPDSAR